MKYQNVLSYHFELIGHQAISMTDTILWTIGNRDAPLWQEWEMGGYCRDN